MSEALIPNLKHSLKLSTAAVCLLGCISLPVAARSLNVSLSESAAILLSTPPDNSTEGYTEALARHSGCQLDQVGLPQARMDPAFRQQRIQILVGVFHNVERNKFATFTPWQIYTPTGSASPPPGGTFSKALSEGKLRLAVVRGSRFSDTVSKQLAILRQTRMLDETSGVETPLTWSGRTGMMLF